MAKKNFRGRETRNLSDIINDKNVVSDDVKTAILGLGASPTSDKLNSIIKIIENDTSILIEDKKELLNSLQEKYISIFNFDNCPEDYEDLKMEAKFLSGVTQYSFMLMAQRLLKIRDNELYKKDGYLDFSSFIENELSISRSTVYNYIDIVTIFGVQPVGRDENIEYTKLLPIIPILKAPEGNNIPKDEIKKRFLSEIRNKSKTEIIDEANRLKLEYGLVKERKIKDQIDKSFKKFYELLLNDAKDLDKNKLSYYIKKLNGLM
ncbi:MAG TPA: hypothetical protein PK385_06405 [Spirochaetota bacterium]|nr:hypothetical protein [Spirochaetota bacterium]HOS32262.1 hypothetical protein [Spirochaetota bacterium]HOS55673.1 hypothetical protein [Spirochaetota bacterium]HPK61371.1 hypothetical protein [Spirochaetota bacterium]HQF78078.1 hypothetical protein [Spirochaetota bacterium]